MLRQPRRLACGDRAAVSEALVFELLCSLVSASAPPWAATDNGVSTVQSDQREDLAVIGAGLNGCEIKAGWKHLIRSQRLHECRASIGSNRRP